MPNETILVITQRDATTQLDPLPVGGVLTLTHEGGLPGPPGPQGPIGPTLVVTGTEVFDPGDLLVYLENGMN
jgi:hypothetical protein